MLKIFDPFIFEKKDIGGVPVFLKQLPWSAGYVNIRIGFRTGGRYDPQNKEGLAHFCEHVPFNGCKGFPGFADIEKLSHELFMNTLNAHTSADDIVFEGKCLTENIEGAFAFFKNFIWHSLLEESEIERERAVIIREIWQRYDSVKNLERILQIRKDMLGESHILVRRMNPTGFEETVKEITRNDIKDFITRAYIREHLCIVIAGDITPTITAVLEKFITDIPNGDPFIAPEILTEMFVSPVRERTHSYTEFFGSNAESTPQHTELEFVRILPSVVPPPLLNLATGFLREVIWATLRGKLGATYSVSLSRTWWKDLIRISFGTHVPPERAQEMKQEIRDILLRMQSDPEAFRDKFIEIKTSMLARLRSSEWSTGDIASTILDDYFLFGTITSLADDYALLEGKQFEDVLAIVRRWFNPDNLYIYIMTP